MFGYIHKREWALDNVRFDYLGGTYQGRGFLTWDPSCGYKLDAFLDRSGTPLPKTIEIGKLRVLRKSELCRVRMVLEDGTRALSPPISLGDHIKLINNNRISVEMRTALFTRRLPSELTSPGTNGTALFDLGKGLLLPDLLENETRLLGKSIQKGVKMGGLVYESDELIVRAWLESETYLRMEWHLMGQEWTRKHAWAWAEAAGWALSFLGGRTVRLLERRTVRDRREFVERRVPGKVEYLGLLSMPPRTSRFADRIDKELFIQLTRFFLQDGKEAYVARRMCEQMSEARRQRSQAGLELICSTVLEAALRTLRNHPFKEGDKTFNVVASIKWFREHYFPRGWEDVCDNAKRCHIRLRHRNAHPDWLTEQGGGLSDAALEQSLDDSIRLAWFYGYMILAMAGVEDLKPELPGSHKTWGPLMTVTRGNSV